MKRVVRPLAAKPVSMVLAVGSGWRWYVAQPHLVLSDLNNMVRRIERLPRDIAQTVDSFSAHVAVPYAKAPLHDKLGVVAEMAVTVHNHGMALLEHHLCPPRVNGKLRLLGYSKAEALEGMKLYCKFIFDPLAPHIKYSRPSWVNMTTSHWVDAPSVSLPNKMRMIWGSYFPQAKC